MSKIKILIALSLLWHSGISHAQESEAGLAEKFLYEGRFVEGETALTLALDGDPQNDELRFGLGVIQVMRAVENLGSALHEYGAVRQQASFPFLRLPIPNNENPSTISYREYGRVLDGLVTDLMRAEKTLGSIKDEECKLKLSLGEIRFDFASDGTQVSMLEILSRINGGREFELKRRIQLCDFTLIAGDVAWLRAYCHVLAAIAEAQRSFDLEQAFQEFAQDVFPKVEEDLSADKESPWNDGIRVADAPRLRRMRLHLLAVCELNRETWHHIRQETDDDFEWLPNTKQTDYLGLPLSDERIDTWLQMMSEWEKLLKGESLLSSQWLFFAPNAQEDQLGLNMRRVLDDPPIDLLNMERISGTESTPKYLEEESSKPAFDVRALLAVFRLSNGPFAFAYAARLN